MEVASVVVKKSIHVTISKLEAKLDRQEIIADEGHQQYKVINDVLYGAPLDSFKFSLKFDAQILSQNIDEDQLKLRPTSLPVC